MTVKDLAEAIETGELNGEELKKLIAEDARALDMSYDEAVESARAGTLPRNHVGADIELLVEMLSV